MPRASKNPISKDIKKEIEEAFSWFLVNEINNSSKVSMFLEDFLTSEERLMLSKRLFIGYLILSGIPHRDICKVLKVSSWTVHSATLRLEGKKGYREVIEKLARREKTKEFIKKIEGIIGHLPVDRKDWLRLAGRNGYPKKG